MKLLQYIACVVLIVILEIVGAVLGFVFREKIVSFICLNFSYNSFSTFLGGELTDTLHI